ncbi:IS5 family transposase [Legionella sp. PATHC038]|nr:IS5 family transposase [Legionella sp. PATHC038]MCW8398094.1 IS5 family transposase [Legionella sp. PATHC038]MCW8398584.1 IS5 family transposase [Legionella sp. PATHC038]MCW8399157.1 IS5 family transposase [Legionella sp. PATHC038]MCW8399490.1 IS5 family transposase [Legionella sp. PATHC038]MCW8400924.1 IS5 family transposase [Legionella sp. PATHC038]
MPRQILTDEIWIQLEKTMRFHGCHKWNNDRSVMEAILWKLRTGAPWRDIPKELCPWKTAYNRFNRWAAKGFMGRFFFDVRGEIDTEWVFTDGSYVRAHQHASGSRLGEERAIGKSRGGATTKIHIAADAHGNPIDFEITGGQVHDSQVACKIIEKVGSADHFIGDKGYDSEDIREEARSAGMNPVIPRKTNSKKPNPEFDSSLYKLRHLVENLFARLKHFRSIATRFEKLARNFKSMLFLACSIIWLKLK